MNKHYQDAARRLHKFAVEDADYSEADLRAELATQGVNVETYLARLGQEAGIKPSAGTAKKPTASERLRALADRTGYKVKGLLSGLGADDVGDLPATAYGRSGRRNKRPHASPRGKRGRKSNG